MQARTIRAAFRELRDRFHRAGIETAALDARLIVQRSVGFSHADFLARADATLTSANAEEIHALAARRVSGEPVSRLFGEREFYGLAFSITPDTLDPRADTETLVEAALEAAATRYGGRKRLTILELGTGTGAVVISILHALRHAEATAVDISPAAIAVARQNAQRHQVAERLKLHTGSWFDGLSGVYDMIVANPPYLSAGDIAALSRDVADHDPLVALDGGGDGLAAYRQIGGRAASFLAPGGLVLLEVGRGQAHAVSAVLSGHGYRPPNDVAGVRRDLQGIERVVLFELPATPSRASTSACGQNRRVAKYVLETGEQKASFLPGRTPKSHVHGALSSGERADRDRPAE
jgi:release factor glutamine methyltransferase